MTGQDILSKVEIIEKEKQKKLKDKKEKAEKKKQIKNSSIAARQNAFVKEGVKPEN